MTSFSEIYQQIITDPQNAYFTARGQYPLYSASSNAVICIVAQAPSRRAQQDQRAWDDASGDQLREWLGLSRTAFYHSGKVALLPMDFYYPGKGRTGDLPPRSGFAAKWHPRLLALMPHIRLIVLVGAVAGHAYLKLPTRVRQTTIVHDYQRYLPHYFPLIHPSARTRFWRQQHPWFESQVVPALQQRVRLVMNTD